MLCHTVLSFLVPSGRFLGVFSVPFTPAQLAYGGTQSSESNEMVWLSQSRGITPEWPEKVSVAAAAPVGVENFPASLMCKAVIAWALGLFIVLPPNFSTGLRVLLIFCSCVKTS